MVLCQLTSRQTDFVFSNILYLWFNLGVIFMQLTIAYEVSGCLKMKVSD